MEIRHSPVLDKEGGGDVAHAEKLGSASELRSGSPDPVMGGNGGPKVSPQMRELACDELHQLCRRRGYAKRRGFAKTRLPATDAVERKRDRGTEKALDISEDAPAAKAKSFHVKIST